MKVLVEISARHFHATHEDFQILFGDEKPSKIRMLSQKDQFASDKTAIVESKNGKQLEVRFLGPFRSTTQVEISKTDAYNLEIEPPIKECTRQDTGGETITLIGPKGNFEKPVAIISERHLHIDPTTAEKIGILNKEFVKVRVGGERSVIFERVLVRVDESFSTSVHLDTDEGNAAGIKTPALGELVID